MRDSEQLLSRLRDSVGEIRGNIAAAFSGGLDSSVIAKIAAEKGAPMLYVVGTKGCKDFTAAASAAQNMGLKLKKIELSKSDILEAVPTLSKVVGTDNKLAISYLLPLWFVCQRCAERTVVTGQGADELFGGYAKYGRISDADAEMKKDAAELKEKGILRDRKIAAHFGRRLITPFLDDAVFDFALNLPLESRISNDTNKILLRDVARLLGLGEIAGRKKRAAQYGSGIAKVLRRSK